MLLMRIQNLAFPARAEALSWEQGDQVAGRQDHSASNIYGPLTLPVRILATQVAQFQLLDSGRTPLIGIHLIANPTRAKSYQF